MGDFFLKAKSLDPPQEFSPQTPTILSFSLAPSIPQRRTVSRPGCLIPGAWLPLGFRENALEGRGHLFEPQASCVPCSPPLAFFRGLRGIAPEIHQHPSPETVLRAPGATMTQHPIKQKNHRTSMISPKGNHVRYGGFSPDSA